MSCYLVFFILQLLIRIDFEEGNTGWWGLIFKWVMDHNLMHVWFAFCTGIMQFCYPWIRSTLLVFYHLSICLSIYLSVYVYADETDSIQMYFVIKQIHASNHSKKWLARPAPAKPYYSLWWRVLLLINILTAIFVKLHSWCITVFPHRKNHQAYQEPACIVAWRFLLFRDRKYFLVSEWHSCYNYFCTF